MNKKYNKIGKLVLAAVVAAGCMEASAQEKSAYFLDGYTFRHQLNPAFMGENNYVSIPVLGNLNIGTHGNIGLGNFLYPMDNGNLTTFMNGAINADEFLGGLKERNRMGMNLNMTLLSFGFKGFGGFNTFEVGLKSYTSMNLPYGLFEFMKTGLASNNKSYSLENMGMNSQTYAEIAFGHSRKINDKLQVGAKVKILLGGAYADFNMKKMDISLYEDAWKINAEGEMNAAVGGLKIPTYAETNSDTEKEKTQVDWGGIELDSPGLAGTGFAIDLGATYEVIEDLTVSAAVTDLGFMNWSNNTYAKTKDGEWIHDGFENIATNDDIEDDPNSLDNQLDKLTNDLEDLTNLHRVSEGGKLNKMLAATLNVGVEYKMPFYKRLSVGMLSHTRFCGQYTYTEGRLSANVSPVNWFQLGVNGSVSNMGSSWGWMLNFHPKGFNLFVGMDYFPSSMSKQFIPINSLNANLNLGLNVTF